MKTSRSIFLLTIINLICTLIFIKYLPDNVVFGFTGEFIATEYVTKWSNLIIPIAQVIACGIIFFIDVFNKDVYHKIRYLTSYIAFAITTYLMWTLMFMQISNFELAVNLSWPWSIIVLFPFALFFFAEGFDEIFYKPMTENSIFAVSWVKNSPIVWSKTHKFSGIMCILTGIITIIIAVVNELVWHTNWIYVIAVLVWLFVYYLFSIIYSYTVAIKHGTK